MQVERCEINEKDRSANLRQPERNCACGLVAVKDSIPEQVGYGIVSALRRPTV